MRHETRPSIGDSIAVKTVTLGALRMVLVKTLCIEKISEIAPSTKTDRKRKMSPCIVNLTPIVHISNDRTRRITPRLLAMTKNHNAFYNDSIDSAFGHACRRKSFALVQQSIEHTSRLWAHQRNATNALLVHAGKKWALSANACRFIGVARRSVHLLLLSITRVNSISGNRKEEKELHPAATPKRFGAAQHTECRASAHAAKEENERRIE